MTKQKEPVSRTTRTDPKPDSNHQKPKEEAQDSPPLLLSKNLSDISRWIIALIRAREWSGLLFAVSGLWVFGFLPKSGLIIRDILPDPLPIFYGQLFWLIEGSLIMSGFCLLLLREYQNLQLVQGKERPVSQKRRIRPLGIFLAVVFLTIGGFYFRQNLRAAVRPSFYLKCDVSGDCFSWGENILMSYGYIQDTDSLENDTSSDGEEKAEKDSQGDTAWEKCKQLWRLKASAVALYDTKSATETLNTFRNQCKNDAEALIYLNNLVALERGKTYDIAISLPISTEGGESESQEILRGVAIAQYKINHSDDAKRGILVGIADDGFRVVPDSGENLKTSEERESAQEIANGLVSLDRLLGIVGHFSSDATEAAAKIYNNALNTSTNIVAISPTSTAIRKLEDYRELGIAANTGIDLPNTVFRTALSDGVVISALVERVLSEYPKTKVGVVYEGNSTYSRLFKESFLAHFKHEGGDVMSNEAQEKCDFDKRGSYSEIACLQAVKDDEVKVLLLVPSTKSSRSVRKLITKNSEELKLPLLGADSMYDNSFLNEKTVGMLLYVTWHRGDNSEALSPFEEEAHELFGTTDVSWRTATAYDATMALNHGIETASDNFCKRNGFLHISRIFSNEKQYIHCLRSNLGRAMHDDKFMEDGSSGENSIKFDEFGNIQRENPGVFVKVSKKGEGYDFVGS